jgi:hypothetical protein
MLLLAGRRREHRTHSHHQVDRVHAGILAEAMKISTKGYAPSSGKFQSGREK